MKRILIGILTALATLFMCLKISAQSTVDQNPGSTPNIVNALDTTAGVTIVVPEGLKTRLEYTTAMPASTTAADAPVSVRPQRQTYYRVEIFADNGRDAKAQASAKRRNVQSRFPKYPAALAFDSPFWRVRVGEFRSRGDAEAAMAEIRQAFPSYGAYLRIVRD